MNQEVTPGDVARLTQIAEARSAGLTWRQIASTQGHPTPAAAKRAAKQLRRRAARALMTGGSGGRADLPCRSRA